MKGIGLPDKHLSFSSLITAIERGGVEARKRLLELSHLKPKMVLPYARELAALLDSSRAPVRSASIEMLAMLSRVSPSAMAFLIHDYMIFYRKNLRMPLQITRSRYC